MDCPYVILPAKAVQKNLDLRDCRCAFVLPWFRACMLVFILGWCKRKVLLT